MTRKRSPEALAARRAARGEIDDSAVVLDAAAAFLAVRPRSIDETRRRLRHLGYRHALVDQVIDRLLELGYLDDAQFARLWIESRDRARPRGESALRRELTLKGVSREVIDEVLHDRSDEASDSKGEGADAAAAGRLLERRRAALERESDPRRRRHRAYALLARSGFDPEVCRDATVAWLADD
ncbi:hypothetical protein BH23CHL7_BH23CHL7_05490 [soil metagenome]